MASKQFLLGFGLGLILLFAVGATYRLYLSDYQEECFEHNQIPITNNYTWQEYNDYACCLGYGSMFCQCKLVNKTITYNTTIDGSCKKYHLVRYVK